MLRLSISRRLFSAIADAAAPERRLRLGGCIGHTLVRPVRRARAGRSECTAIAVEKDCAAEGRESQKTAAFFVVERANSPPVGRAALHFRENALSHFDDHAIESFLVGFFVGLAIDLRIDLFVSVFVSFVRSFLRRFVGYFLGLFVSDLFGLFVSGFL